MGFEGGKCSLIDHVCKDLTAVGIRKKIHRSFRFAHQWGVQFYGDDFDFLTLYQTDDSFDINQIHIGRGDDVLDIDFHDALVLDMDLQWDRYCTVDERQYQKKHFFDDFLLNI